MARRSRATATSHMLALGAAVPQVVTQRLLRMAEAGCSPTARDRRELSGMVLEKQTAFAQSWVAMWAESCRVQQQWALSWMQSGGALQSWSSAGEAWEQILGSGLAPIRRKAVANAKRLARESRRKR